MLHRVCRGLVGGVIKQQRCQHRQLKKTLPHLINTTGVSKISIRGLFSTTFDKNEASITPIKGKFSSSAAAIENSNDEEFFFPPVEEEVMDANERYRGKIEIRQTPDKRGYGLFALKKFAANEKVMTGNALQYNDYPCSHSVQTNWDDHVLMDLPARFSNHACYGKSNLGVVDNIESGAYDYYAMEDIEEGEELLWDYATSEYKVTEKFGCRCGSPQCRGVLKGFYEHGDELKASYGEKWIASYLLTNDGKK